MKFFSLTILLLVFLSTANAQTSYSSFEKKAFSFYNDKTEDSFIYYNKLATQSYIDSNNDFGAARCLQNLGFYYQEQRKDYFKSFFYISLSLDKWEKLKDTVNEANLVKYIALLYNYLGYPKRAIEKEAVAISMFQQANYEPGIYVAYFDLAIIYQNQGDCDNANEYLLKAKSYWLKEKNAIRLFSINNYLLKCINDHKSQAFTDLVNENNTYLKTAKIPDELVNTFKGVN